jgi:membrane protein
LTKLERLILRSGPVAYLLRKSQTWVLPGFRGLPLYDVANYFLKQVKKIGLYERASAISFNLIMALPAGILFLFSLIPLFPQPKSFRKEILSLFKDITPNSSTYSFITNILNDLIENQHIGVFSFGFLLLIFYSSNAMIGIIRTFDKSIKEHSGVFLHRRLKAIRLTFILIILVLTAALALFLGRQQLIYVLKNVFNVKRDTRIFWWSWIRWGIIVTLLFYGIAVIYKFGPSVNKRWKLLSPGAILATFLTLITTVLFSYWVNNFASYNKVYGSIGTVLIIMVLVYVNALILLIGFELNVSITYLTKEVEEQKRKKQAALK